jgi:hypothetical protein
MKTGTVLIMGSAGPVVSEVVIFLDQLGKNTGGRQDGGNTHR